MQILGDEDEDDGGFLDGLFGPDLVVTRNGETVVEDPSELRLDGAIGVSEVDDGVAELSAPGQPPAGRAGPLEKWTNVNTPAPGPAADLASGGWQKDSQNPVFRPGTWDSPDVFDPELVREGNTFIMLYAGGDAETKETSIGLATSENLREWNRRSSPVLEPTGSGWESQALNSPAISKAGDTYHLFYSGWDGSTGSIGHATSTDLVNWTRDPNNPIIEPTETWEGNKVDDPAVSRVGFTFNLLYTGSPSGDWKVGLASGTDPSTLSKSAANPVLGTSTGTWRSDQIDDKDLIVTANRAYLSIEGYDGQNGRIGVAATALDGDWTSWTWSPRNPVLDIGPTGSWEERWVTCPAVVQARNRYEMVYHGYDDTQRRIGHATLPIGSP